MVAPTSGSLVAYLSTGAFRMRPGSASSRGQGSPCWCRRCRSPR